MFRSYTSHFCSTKWRAYVYAVLTTEIMFRGFANYMCTPQHQMIRFGKGVFCFIEFVRSLLATLWSSGDMESWLVVGWCGYHVTVQTSGFSCSRGKYWRVVNNLHQSRCRNVDESRGHRTAGQKYCVAPTELVLQSCNIMSTFQLIISSVVLLLSICVVYLYRNETVKLLILHSCFTVT